MAFPIFNLLHNADKLYLYSLQIIRMALEQCRKRRIFSKMREPKGGKEKSKRVPIFVVQEHHARNLHYDFRLEIGGVLKSWAVPKGVPLSGEKRLAIRTEDHPIEYAKCTKSGAFRHAKKSKIFCAFHGTIPEGLYGAGTVKIWDSGKYVPESVHRDKIVFELRGKKLKGKYVLVKTKFAKNSWLLFRKK